MHWHATVGGKMEGLKNGKILISTPQIINDNILLEKIEKEMKILKKLLNIHYLLKLIYLKNHMI